MPGEKQLVAYATLFCTCGWVMTGTNGDQIYCENPKCEDRSKIFKLQISLLEVVAKTA